MRNVQIYTTPFCPYCVQAKRLLDQRGVAFEEIDVEGDDERRAWLLAATGRRTVPQIFFGDESIGGFTELMAIVRQGKLDEKLGRAASAPSR